MDIAAQQQQVLCDTKWQKFLGRTWLFRHIPFVTAAFGAGSLALGNVTDTSDFDVLVCATPGRIFTARFFSAIMFGLFGWRRSKMDHRVSAADKVCLNHFVTEPSYRLRLPANAYWKLLYNRMVPMYGSPEEIQKFFDANRDWAGERHVSADVRHRWQAPSAFKGVLEKTFAGTFGNWLEAKLKAYQVSRIEKGLPNASDQREPHLMKIHGASKKTTIKLPPLISYTDQELDFHPDPAIIELR